MFTYHVWFWKLYNIVYMTKTEYVFWEASNLVLSIHMQVFYKDLDLDKVYFFFILMEILWKIYMAFLISNCWYLFKKTCHLKSLLPLSLVISVYLFGRLFCIDLWQSISKTKVYANTSYRQEIVSRIITEASHITHKLSETLDAYYLPLQWFFICISI